MIKKIAVFTILLCSISGFCQEEHVGIEAANASQASIDYQWENWTFAGTTLVAATTAIFVIASGNGQSSSGH